MNAPLRCLCGSEAKIEERPERKAKWRVACPNRIFGAQGLARGCSLVQTGSARTRAGAISQWNAEVKYASGKKTGGARTFADGHRCPRCDLLLSKDVDGNPICYGCPAQAQVWQRISDPLPASGRIRP